MFYFEDFNGKKVLKSSLLNEVEHFFTTRDFILTTGEREELKDLTEENRTFLCSKLGIPRQNLICAKQTHSDNICSYEGSTNFFDNCDALISNKTNTAIILNFADCVPIILFDETKKIAAVVHAGWRGTAQKILSKTIEKFEEDFGSAPSDIIAAIGPSIGKCCFETRKEAFEQLINEDTKQFCSFDKEKNKYYIDLKQLNKKQLLDNGVVKIDVSDYCTCCMSDIFFSYRKEKGKTARHSAIIKL